MIKVKRDNKEKKDKRVWEKRKKGKRREKIKNLCVPGGCLNVRKGY